MRRTNLLTQTVFWSFLLGMALGNTVTAQQPPNQLSPPALVKEASARRTEAVPLYGTKRVQLASKGRIVKVFNPAESVVRVTPIPGDPMAVMVYGVAAGVSRITLVGEGNAEETVDVVVQLDLEYLRKLLSEVVPTAAVQPLGGANNTVILTGNVARAEDVDIIMRTAASVVGGPERVIDAMRVGGVMQVQLDTVVAHVNRTAMRAMGFNLLASGPSAIFGSTIGNLTPLQTVGTVLPSQFSGNGNAAGGGGGGAGGQAGAVTGGTINASPGNANLFLGVVTRSGSFFGFLQALRDEGLAKLLTEPRLVTMSGEPASLLSGGKQAIPEAQGLGTISVRFEPFGTQLNFLPIVLGNGKIHLDIQTVVSQLNQASGTTISGTAVPGRDEQSARTTVEIEDGQTLAIGGLIQHIATALTNKVPVLGDLPWVGAAFSVKSYTDTEEELVILVTPHLVDPMACNQLPKILPGEETRKPDDYELFLEGILEAPRGPRVPFPADRRFVPAYKNGPTAGVFPCGTDGRCGLPGHGDPLSPVNRPPIGSVEARPLSQPVAATPPGSPGDASASNPAASPSPDAAANAEQNKSAGEPNRPVTLPATLPGPANQDDKGTR
jgi:pilus assembly protein CpaC